MATLKRNPARRLPTAGHVADALEAFLYALGKPCGAAQVSTWLSTRATTMVATEPTRSASHPEPAIARPTSPEPETRPIPLVPDGCATETASLPPQRHPVAFPGPSSETRPLGPGILGESVAELSTVILAPPESATPTPGPGGAPTTSSARAPRPARRELRLAIVAAVVSAMAIGAWVGTRRRSGATEATRSAIPRQMDPIPPIGG
ncbi:MAG: hypothetical protein IT379_21920, partial [Deltaproteobacteria bacterium]|nr:hypothetical protein [Deltaproteobacteria bacterium]